eukprot:796176-Rhodomonas_salina.2
MFIPHLPPLSAPNIRFAYSITIILGLGPANARAAVPLKPAPSSPPLFHETHQSAHANQTLWKKVARSTASMPHTLSPDSNSWMRCTITAKRTLSSYCFCADYWDKSACALLRRSVGR